jgi:hypothetical protein
VADSQLTANASTTIFNTIPTGTNTGRVRDFRLSGQLDIGLPKISDSLGKPTMTFSGLYMDLLQQPLGQQVLVNDVPVNQKGNVGVFQAKVSFPAGKGSGVTIPISFTYATRTELIKESDVRGQMGVTFNLESIFSKPK